VALEENWEKVRLSFTTFPLSDFLPQDYGVAHDREQRTIALANRVAPGVLKRRPITRGTIILPQKKGRANSRATSAEKHA
jgi:hypothetical protein